MSTPLQFLDFPCGKYWYLGRPKTFGTDTTQFSWLNNGSWWHWSLFIHIKYIDIWHALPLQLCISLLKPWLLPSDHSFLSSQAIPMYALVFLPPQYITTNCHNPLTPPAEKRAVLECCKRRVPQLAPSATSTHFSYSERRGRKRQPEILIANMKQNCGANCVCVCVLVCVSFAHSFKGFSSKSAYLTPECARPGTYNQASLNSRVMAMLCEHSHESSWLRETEVLSIWEIKSSSSKSGFDPMSSWLPF